jgi:hypothetical protein
MKKQAVIISIIVTVPLLTIIFNAGDLKCQENSNGINTQYQSKYMERSTMKGNEDNMKDDKNISVEILELIIKRNLLYEYQKLDSEELENMVERSR